MKLKNQRMFDTVLDVCHRTGLFIFFKIITINNNNNSTKEGQDPH